MQQPRRKSGYLPSLDGWRAIAIFGVLMNHDLPWTIAGHTNERVRGYGGWGVYLFFAISGFLICTRILEEEASAGKFHLKSFYVRRLFRIQPAACVYLATIAVLLSAGAIYESPRYWWGALLCYANYQFTLRGARLALDAFTGHFWTLAVEEHFYILLSLMLYSIRKHRVAIFAVLIAVLLKFQGAGLDHGWYSEEVSTRRTFWLVQYLLIPAWFALLLRVPWIRYTAGRFLQPWVAYLLTLGWLLQKHFRGHMGPADSAHSLFPYLYLVFSLWVIATVFHPQSWSTRLLELAPIRFLGRLSYSLYLWHVLFFVGAYHGVRVYSPTLLLLSHRPWKYVCSFALAALSYFFIEKPLIRLGHRLAPPVTPGHADMAASVAAAGGSGALPLASHSG